MMIEQDREQMEVSTTTIKISPITASRQADLCDLPMPSPINLNTNANTDSSISNAISIRREPLQQQTSVERTPRYHSPLQRGPRKEFNYGHSDHRNTSNSSCGERYSHYNDENRSGVNRFAHFRRTLMQDHDDCNECDTSDGGVPNLVHSDRTFVCDIDAPSDEREEDESVYEILSIIEQQQEEYDQHRDCPENAIEGNEEGNESDREDEEETDEQKRQREEEESLVLARQLMAEEAMASYAESSNFLRSHANEYSEEDLHALEALMAEEDPMVDEAEEMADGDGSLELSYETLLQLGERIGDVKSERWALKAEQEIAKLETISFNCHMAKNKDENDCSVKCLICQFQYQEGDSIRVLPCKHRFHKNCVDQWLMTRDHCPYCRQCITE